MTRFLFLTRRIQYAFFSVLLLLLSPSVTAEQFKNIGSLEVHYSALNATFIPANVAKTYGIQRGSHNALINIAILDKAQAGKPALTATLEGTARNLLGTRKQLTFREVKEGKAIYYLAEVRFANEENLIFDIEVHAQGNRAGKLTFQQQFYTE
ncbi:hypothetical protein BCT30_12645 [Enterovibrio norvegicus]|uniref:DUF4426 domain-containing protein n=2 Tax=Enterovibrio norvegicus TaxID=188144 RepID=A0A2N7LC86_9GAMM|nr:DUF4426 domain-containing protein [Enterovibrio norvegicus]OEE56494.1 hypothetical protein A1OS_22150 [Enterovibrio norvegicus]OEF54122.1 hypothetical protein A1OW_22510 [Enterovibrio norvegicus]OEF54439.1 hypothetical protein A1OU_01345 [Enterovibrio norvegicus]PMH72781.1 hypothetical protein BCU62_00135 [Enterovibrio norvegicus]PMI36523.1 hypothetical protein BCU46_13880 [Enterovibrio norvegicus]